MKTRSELERMARLIGAIPERDFVSPVYRYHRSVDGLDSARIGWSDGKDRRFEVVYFADDHVFCRTYGPDLKDNESIVTSRIDLIKRVRDGMDWLYGPMVK